MELRHLRYFVTLAETLNFTRAAELLYISQSALSQQVADMESELGVRLFRRTKRSVELTHSGKVMLNESRKVLRQMEQMVPAIRDSALYADQQRNILIGIDMRAIRSSCLRQALTDRVYCLREKLPGLQADFLTYEHDALVRALESNAVDVGFFLHQQPTPKENSTLACLHLQKDEMVLAVRTEQKLEDRLETLNGVINHRGIILLENENRGMFQAMRIVEELKIEPSIHFVSNRDSLILSLESGERATILPASILLEMQTPHLQILHFGVPSAALHYLASWHPNNNNPLIADVVQATSQSFSSGSFE